jgi:hypothetical protein
VKLLGVLGAAAAAALAAFAAPAGATNECRGLQVCVHVAGPWVVVPSSETTPRPRVEYELSCPKGYIVGGLDAELTDRAIDVSFQGLIGAPVNPGITTGRAVLFVATSAHRLPAGATFRPHIGCLPASGGGGRIPTVAHVNVVPPGHPDTRRVTTVTVTPGTKRVSKTCAAGETLVSATHAVGFYTQKPPTVGLVSNVNAGQKIHRSGVTVTVKAGPAVSTVRTIVQIDLTCGGGA